VRGAQERDAAATIPFVAIGGEKTRSHLGRARTDDSESGKARSHTGAAKIKTENRNEVPSLPLAAAWR